MYGKPPAIDITDCALAVFMLVCGGFYGLVMTCGYTFYPFNRYVTNCASAAIIILLMVRWCSGTAEKTKAAAVCSALLPLIAIFFIFGKAAAVSPDRNDGYIFIVHANITLICSMILLLFFNHRPAVKIGLGAVYTLLMVPIFFLLFVSLIFGNISQNTVIQTEMSPGSVYVAEAVVNNQGALAAARWCGSPGRKAT